MIGPNDRDGLSIVGDTYRILISGKDTEGAFAMIDMLVPPGGGPGPHAHAHFEETFFVMEGQMEVKSEAGVYTAATGSFITIPKGGVIHGFKNKSDKMAHLLCTVSPAGLEEFFVEIGVPVKFGEFLPPPPMNPEMMEKLLPVLHKYGQEVYPPDYLD